MRVSIFVVVLLLAHRSASASGSSLSAAEAKNHVGEHATVCGQVASEKTAMGSKGQPTFINLDAPYPHQIFSILVWGEDRQSVGALPTVESRLCATGTVQDYRGVPEIVVKSKDQLSK